MLKRIQELLQKRVLKRISVSLLLATLVIAAASCANGASSADSAAWTLKFSTESLAGDRVTEADFAGNRLTILNVFATWCPPCIAELPELGIVANDYTDKGVQLVGILQDGVNQLTLAADKDVIKQAQTLLDNAKAEYLVILPDAAIWNKFVAPLQFVPTTFFLDETGEVVETLIGSRDASEWAKEIDAALAKLDK